MEVTIVSYIDILGFAAAVKDLANSRPKLSFQDVKLTIENFVSNLGVDMVPSEVSVSSFSDCVIRARKIQTSESISKVLKEEIKRIANCQLWCLQDGFIVRGGIAIGNHFEGLLPVSGFQDVRTIISPAMIDAYFLETKRAKYPRVVLDQSTVKAHKLTDWEVLQFDKARELYYIDYLWMFYCEEGEHDHERFSEHFDLISAGLLSKNKEVKSKFRWLKGYHNRTLDRILEQEWAENKSWQQQFSYRQYLKLQREEMPFIY